MKTAKIISLVLLAGLTFSILLTSCELTPEIKSEKKDILPESFGVDIPSSISNSDAANGRLTNTRVAQDLKGNDIYINLNTFIAVGEGAAKLVEAFINAIRIHHIDQIMTLTFVGEDDNRTKNLIVSSEVSFEGKTWDYQLTVTDAASESATDGGKALQIFWNKSDLVKGIAIIKPYNCDRIKNANAKDAVFRVDYTQGGATGYDEEMEVFISGFPLGNPLENPYAINTLHMFVGKKGDAVDVFGNSNHPNAILFSGQKGFNWAFVASGSDSKDIAAAEVGLPPCTLDNDDRDTLLKQYSIKNVFTTEIQTAWPGIDPSAVASYLTNTAAPGYFNKTQGFISGGVSPGSDWDIFATRLNTLSPYNPKKTNDLVINFK
jgi:hypothetical protein